MTVLPETIGPYEITREIGRGGMGVVYLARDTKLDRDVAIKALPPEVAEDKERLERFEREAKLLASLNHPHIATIFGLEEADSHQYLILEYVEGETLAQRLEHGAIPVTEALAIAKQIAEAIEAAHEKGVIHRDLKPANIKFTADDQVKVLDFGLAKSIQTQVLTDTEIANSPTMVSPAPGSPTMPGVILGTAGYLSPEQAKGRPVDTRTDIFAFGCILYEMLTGESAFTGETVADTIGATLHKAIDYDRLPSETPPLARHVLKRCLLRDRKQRWHDIGDARLELEACDEPLGEPVPASGERHGARRWRIFAAAFVLGTLVTAGVVWLRSEPAPIPPTMKKYGLSNLNIQVDAFQSLALSPDGSRLIIPSRDADGNVQLYVRQLDSLEEMSPIPESENGWLPFFSPDGERVAFYSIVNIMTASLNGGAAQSIGNYPEGFAGGAWMSDGTIIFAGGTSGPYLFQVSSSGGPIERLEIEGMQPGHIITSPSPLPGGDALLCSIGREDRFDIAVYSREEGTLRVIAENGFSPMYAASGYVVFQQGLSGPLVALPFDPNRLVATGPAFPAITDIRPRSAYHMKLYSISNDGTLAFFPDKLDEGGSDLLWVKADGTEELIASLDGEISNPTLSPDGGRVAYQVPGPNCQIWIHDLARSATSRVTHEGDNHGNLWTAEGSHIITARGEGANYGIVEARADGAGSIRELLPPVSPWIHLTDVSRDGVYALANSGGGRFLSDISLVTIENQSIEPLLNSRFREVGGVFSHDGGLLAYSSDESGHDEVYIQPFPALDERVQASVTGGIEPVWGSDGKTLYFRSGGNMISVNIRTEPRLTVDRPTLLFADDYTTSLFGGADYDVSDDGQRFITIRQRTGSTQDEVIIVLNWFEELKRLDPTKK